MTTTSLKQDYRERIVPALMKEFSYTTVMQVPKLEKIVLNQGLGIATADKKIIDTAIHKTKGYCDIHQEGYFEL